MSFCKNCGAMLEEEKICPNCGTPVETKSEQRKFDDIATSNTGKQTNLWMKIVLGGVLVVIAVFMITRFTSTVDEPCDWCGSTPSVAYKMHDDSYSYVCKNCSKKCAWCGNKAIKHYENLAGMMVFVCKDCYEDVAEE